MRLLLLALRRRLWRERRKNLAFLLTLFVSVFMLSFFLLFEMYILSFLGSDPTLRTLPFGEFLSAVASSMSVTVSILLLAMLITIGISCGMRRDGDEAFFATLTSLGATEWQKTVLRLWEMAVLYASPVVLAAFAGRFAARASANILADAVSGADALAAFGWRDILLCASITAVCLLFILFVRFFPRLGRRSVASGMRPFGSACGFDTPQFSAFHSVPQYDTYRTSCR